MFHSSLFLIYIKNYKINNKNNKNNKCIYCGNDEWSDLCTCS